MICNFPTPTLLCSLWEARIVMPSLVMEFIGTIGQSAPHQRGDRVGHHPIFVFGYLHFVELFPDPVRCCSENRQFPSGQANERLLVLRGHHLLLETVKSFRRIDSRPSLTS